MSGESEMTEERTAPAPLNRPLRRVIGVLIEKAFCTPEYYPLSANAIVTGCNQKSNRNPVTNYAPHMIDESLLALQEAGLVIRVFPAGGRVERWKHNVKEAWQLDRPHRAVLAELILRGPQTEGELRSRASRMVAIDSLEMLADILATLTDRGFVRRLSPGQQKRGVVWTHLLYPPDELAQIEARISDYATSATASDAEDDAEDDADGAAPARTTANVPDASTQARLLELESKLAALQTVVDQLQQEVSSVRSTVEMLVDNA
jgi:hypothetical protein